MIKVIVDAADFDIGMETAEIGKIGGGAIASFVGQVRQDEKLVALELEHYPAMTQKALENIANSATNNWPLHAVTIIHRVGKLSVGENIVLAIASSDHRAAAINACSFIMDQLKTVAPFWKKEISVDGSTHWVEERRSDLDAANQWLKN